MQLVGQQATTCVLTAMSLSWRPSGVMVAYTCCTGAQVAATQLLRQAAM